MMGDNDGPEEGEKAEDDLFGDEESHQCNLTRPSVPNCSLNILM